MGKLSERWNDKRRAFVSVSREGIKQGIRKGVKKAKDNWPLFKAKAREELRTTFTVRNAVASVAVLALAVAGTYTFAEKVQATELVYRVYIDGDYYGLVRDKTMVDAQMAALAPKLHAEVRLEPVHQTVTFTSEAYVAKALEDSTKIMTDMVAVRVNGRDLVYVRNEATAQALIDKLKAQYPSKNGKVELADRVDFIPIKDDIKLLTDPDKAFKMIYEGTNEKRTYVVSRGDSLWDIANRNKMTLEELQAANPQIPDIDAIAEGQNINLVASDPLIDVKTTTEENREIIKNYEIEYRDDNSLYMGDERVIQEGKEGKTKQTVRVTKINGIVSKEDVLKEEVLNEPVKEIIAKGTKRQTFSSYTGGSAKASGNWAYPIGGGYISSQYGEMRGGKAHLALDIAAATGTPVYASNSGTVIRASANGDGYGNCIMIDHGGGIISLYGHLSSMNVSAGQTVQKGQYIGGVGSTGWSTGSHLHYEVRVNGYQVNPAPYM
ncbi:MAG TPA: peptidoglycan DD-metalloendopeptidase family protein [Bacilli bacterium]|nr:peptidoglycan DD-metalloendopeptidase family protein [Bacilli bacterium]